MARVSLWVGNLPYRISREEFQEAFEQFGEVKSVTIARRDGRSSGYGFVDFASDEALDNCLSSSQEIVLGGRVLEYREARPRAAAPGQELQAAVLQIPNSVTDDQLLDHFQSAGAVSGHIVHHGRGPNLSFGCVTFASKDARDHAIATMNGSNLAGSRIVVKEVTRPFKPE